jgi:nucleotide-binding universal stress UspA family protein
MIDKVLLAYSGSPSAAHTYAFAAELCRRFGAVLHVLAVVQPSDVYSGRSGDGTTASARRQLEQGFADLHGARPSADLKVVLTVESGHAATCIVLYAEHHGIDHIVMGQRGQTSFERWLAGSVSRAVVAYAPCAVTVVRPVVDGRLRESLARQRAASQLRDLAEKVRKTGSGAFSWT